jgi:hypothetical protein
VIGAISLSSDHWRVLNKAVKQPKCEKWKGFQHQWKLWFSLSQMDATVEPVLLVNSLPEQDAALYLEQL